jgi:putative membrane protein
LTEHPSANPGDDPVHDDALIRTHLANERTFLAWLRSAVVLIGAGLAATAIAGDHPEIRGLAILLGSAAALGGSLMVAWALAEYRRNIVGINRREFRPARLLPVAATLFTVALAFGALVLAILEFTRD